MSYVQNLIHAVFRTYTSEDTLPTDDRVKFLYQDIWGIIKNKGGQLYRINSMSDHVHLLFTIPPVISLSDFMKAIKASSSKIIKTKEGFENFKSWGEGYAALSYSLRDKEVSSLHDLGDTLSCAFRRLKSTVNKVSSLRDCSTERSRCMPDAIVQKSFGLCAQNVIEHQ